jgi:cytochrome oxidase Cu insertion factor (SCO1/SenC/PrrC family)
MGFARTCLSPVRLWWMVGIALLLASTAGTATGEPVEPPMGLAAVKPAAPMPAFQLPGLNGSTLESSQLQGKVVVVRFWATW